MAAARAAFHSPSWSEINPSERGQLLYNLADLVEKNTDLLATLDTWDMGKPLSVAKAEDLSESIAVFKYNACHRKSDLLELTLFGIDITGVFQTRFTVERLMLAQESWCTRYINQLGFGTL